MSAWPVSWEWAVAWRFGLLSQQPVRPQTRHWRRCTHELPISTQVGQTVSAAGRSAMAEAKWGQGRATAGEVTDRILAPEAARPLDTGRMIRAEGLCRHAGEKREEL